MEIVRFLVANLGHFWCDVCPYMSTNSFGIVRSIEFSMEFWDGTWFPWAERCVWHCMLFILLRGF